jgi:hypothetical protein
LRDFRLDALLYFSPTSWSIWLNGGHVTPTSVPADMRINAITPDYVEIVWWPDPDVPDERRIFTLSPDQVYSAETDEVLDATTLAYGMLELMPELPQIGDGRSGTVESDGHARPEELTLTTEQANQLIDLEDALKAQE